MALISVIEFHFAVFVQAFKFLQLLSLIYNRVAAKVLPWGDLIRLYLASMLIKKFEYLIARFLSCCLLPSFPSSAHALPVLGYNLADDYLVYAVHYELMPTAKPELQITDAFLLETFHPKVYR